MQVGDLVRVLDNYPVDCPGIHPTDTAVRGRMAVVKQLIDSRRYRILAHVAGVPVDMLFMESELEVVEAGWETSRTNPAPSF